MKVIIAVSFLIAVLVACGGRQGVEQTPPAPTPTVTKAVEVPLATPTPALAVGRLTATKRVIPTTAAPVATFAAVVGAPSPSPTPTTPTRATLAPPAEATPTATTPAATATPTATRSAIIPALEFPSVTVTGLIATVPGYARVDVGEAAKLIEQVYPGRVPRSIQALILLTEGDEAYLVLALDTDIDRFVTAGTVKGYRLPPLPGLPAELDFAGRLIISDDVQLMEPLRVTPDEVNQSPEKYAFKRIVAHTTYVFSSARVKDAPPSLDHSGFAVASDRFGSQSRDDYLTVVDPYNTEAQIRVADLVGTVLFPTKGIRLLLGQLYKFMPDDVENALSRPAIFYEALVDDDAQLLNIRDLMPTVADPSLKLHKYHGEMVSVQGLALGEMVRTEDIPQLDNLPVHVTAKIMGVADLTGAMPIVGISSEDVSGEVFGFFRFDLSVYNFADQAAYAFLINKEAVLLDPVEEVTRAEFGDRVKATLEGYFVTETARVQLADDLTLEQVDLLLPTDPDNPIIMTRHSDLKTGDYLSKVDVDGYLVDGKVLGLPQELLAEYGPGTLVVNAQGIRFEVGIPPLPTSVVPTPVAVPTPIPTPVPTPTLVGTSAAVTPSPAATMVPVATATPVPVPTPTPLPTATPTPVPTYVLTVAVEPSDGGTVTMSPAGGSYPVGTVVTLTAIPAPGYTFDGWEGDASGGATTVEVKMVNGKAISAHFKRSLP